MLILFVFGMSLKDILYEGAKILVYVLAITQEVRI